MAKEGYWVTRTYEAGAVGEKSKFWVMGSRDRRNRKREKAEIKKQEENEAAAVKRLARLINANFGEGDILLGLDYSPAALERLQELADETQGEPMDALRAAAEKELRLLIRRVKRELAKSGTELRYLAITSDLDGKTGEAVRVHHHLLIPADCLDAFLDKWEYGGIDWEELQRQADYFPVANYFLRQVRRVRNEKKYIRSRNLLVPQPKDRAVTSDAELRVPKGGELLHRTEYRRGQPQYIRYVLPPDKRRPPSRA